MDSLCRICFSCFGIPDAEAPSSTAFEKAKIGHIQDLCKPIRSSEYTSFKALKDREASVNTPLLSSSGIFAETTPQELYQNNCEELARYICNAFKSNSEKTIQQSLLTAGNREFTFKLTQDQLVITHHQFWEKMVTTLTLDNDLRRILSSIALLASQNFGPAQDFLKRIEMPKNPGEQLPP